MSENHQKYSFIFSAGGTGGHIFPAVAVADELKRRHPQATFHFVGAKGKMEMEKVPQAGYTITGLPISGLQRKLTLKNILFPVRVLSSLTLAKKIIRQYKPDVVVGFGGYASAPTLRAANKGGIPTVIQEQNSYAGLANKWVAKKANTICVAYENMGRFFPENKIVMTGNPVRSDINEGNISREEAIRHFDLNPDKKTLLVIGGSLGARTINDSVFTALNMLKEDDIQVIWQCGKFYHEEFVRKMEGITSNDSVKLMPFIMEMNKAYAAADVVVSRAGALSISELCLVGKPVVFVPSPNVSEDHQTKNAMALVEKHAALLVKDDEARVQLGKTICGLFEDEEQQEKLANNIKALAKPEATKRIADEIEKLLI